MSSAHNDPGPAPKDLGLGATGRYPNGRIVAGDQGELKAAIACDMSRRIIFIDFGKPVTWLSLDSKLARHLAGLLVHHADQLDESTKAQL